MKLRFLLCGLLVASMLQAQSSADSNAIAQMTKMKRNYELPDPRPFAETIRAEDAKILLEMLASKEMQGRETGEEGQRKAADYIAAQFKAAGLLAKADRNTYFQDIRLRNTTWTDIGMKVEDQEFKNRTDFYVYHGNNPDNPLLRIKEVVFVGYGIEDSLYTDYEKADVAGKAVIFYEGEPALANGKFIITGDPTQIDLPTRQSSGLLQALRLLKKVEGISVIELDNSDVIRHKLVKAIIEKYETK